MTQQLPRGLVRRTLPLPLALLVQGLASACAGPTALPSYSAQRQAWERADSAAPAPAQPFEAGEALERGALVRGVLARNPSIRAARQAWRAAVERHPQVTALDDPMLGFGTGPRSYGSRQVDSAEKLDLSQKLPFPGKLALRGEAALAEAEAAAQDHAAVRLRLATMASLLYDGHYLATRSLEINREHVALLQEFQQIATARYETGEASQQDPIQAEVALTHALHREVVLETERRITAEQINLLLHRRPDAALPPPPRVLPLPVGPAEAKEGLLAAALEAHPELRAAGARTRAREADRALARREFFPDFTLTGSYNRLWQEEDLQPFVGLQLNLPLQLRRRRAALAEAEARLERARSARTALADQVRFQIQSGMDRLEEARHVLRLFRSRLVPAARDQVAAARAGFETGRNSFLALIDAERNRLDVSLGLEEARAGVAGRRAELDRALGRVPALDWQEVAP